LADLAAEVGSRREMTDLKPFQKSTVHAVLAAFDKRRRNRRFLVADEVGLGKTVIAQHVIHRMMSGRTKPLVVFYMCSNLAIARQNRRKLLEVVPSEERGAADCPVDRLSLLMAGERPTHPALHLYSLTPDTSIPIRKRHRRDGRQEERALVHALIERVCPRFFNRQNRTLFQRSATVYWEHVLDSQREKARRRSLRLAFAQSIRKEFELSAGQHILPALQKLEHEELRLIAHLRNALAASALEEIQPDLVIYDEFQRFRDLVENLSEKTEEERAAQRVIGHLRGDDAENPPALLLLSATPYRLFTRRWEEEAGSSHRSEFFELVEFLYGSDSPAAQKRKDCERAFVELETELRKGLPTSPKASQSRLQVEELLCPIIARTERASHQNGWDNFHTDCLPAPIGLDDLSVFKHLSRSFDQAHQASAVPYWTSIPLPMQTMGHHYVAWKSSGTIACDGTPMLNEKMRNGYETPAIWPHPRLRALRQLAKPEQLALPWLSPTAAWWPLRGAWKGQQQHRKLLVFSRFRAVPQAIAASISFDLEARFLADEGMPYSEVSRRRLLSTTDKRHALLGLFHASPFLINATDPLVAGSGEIQVIRREVRRQLKTALGELGITIRDRGPSLPVWRLLARLEQESGNWNWISEAWRWIHSEVATGDSEDSGLGQLLTDWDEEARGPLENIKPGNFEALVDYALGSPGVVVGRSLRRHWEGAISDVRDSKGLLKFRHTLSASWMGLRNYLDQRWFYRALCKGNESYPDALLRVTIDGNLEAVLDEHLWIISRLRSLSEDELAIELRDGFTLKSGMFYLHPLEGERDNTFSLRCHVAMPFVQSRVQSLEAGEKPIRTDEMRRAFNTPFWPYVLATTSVGQEGLDFHTWCDTLIHWDLCRNPVDLEQREGRIQRFGGLSIRRAIAESLAEAAKAVRRDGESPWTRIEAMANDMMSDDSGLAPWWVCKNGTVNRYVFEVPTSEQNHWLRWMKEQRLLYRLALGQPNQEDLLEILSSKVGMDPDSIRQAVVNLSPWFRAHIR
jgi:hypothetical protein